MTPRESVLLRGLDDWVALEAVHSAVAEANGGAPTSVVQDETLALIRSLVDEGLFRLGDLATANQEFSAWGSSLDESIERIRDVYISNFDDQNVWPWYCWLDLTEKGEQVANEIEASTGSRPDN